MSLRVLCLSSPGSDRRRVVRSGYSRERPEVLLTRTPPRSEWEMYARCRIPVQGIPKLRVLPKGGGGGGAFLYGEGRLSASGPLGDPRLEATLARELVG